MIKFNYYKDIKIFDESYLFSIDGVEALAYGRDKNVVYALNEGKWWKTPIFYREEEPIWVECQYEFDKWMSIEERDRDLACEPKFNDFWEDLYNESKSMQLVDDDIYAGYESDYRGNLKAGFSL